jgi:3-dehydroquinate dehydratase-2
MSRKCVYLLQNCTEVWTNRLCSCRLVNPCEVLLWRVHLAHVLVLNGPNLNLLGDREPDKYGHSSLQEIVDNMERFARDCGHELSHEQHNSEGDLVESIQKASLDSIDFIIFNPAAYTHTSVALRDALLAVEIPFIEVHLSAVHAREPFRQVSYFSDIALGVITGFHGESYMLALQAIVNRIDP